MKAAHQKRIHVIFFFFFCFLAVSYGPERSEQITEQITRTFSQPITENTAGKMRPQADRQC